MSEPREIGERAFEFAVRVVKLCRAIDGGDNASRVLSRQLIRSGTSIGANIEEGKGSQSRADFRAKYSIALKEARETHYWLRLLRGTGCPGHPELEALIRESDELIRILTSIIKKLKANP
ncbi:MAG: four helix bundle protein [Planctomycetota bacterium]